MKSVLNRYLDTVGDGTGTKNARGTYVTATDFLIKPGASESFIIESLTVIVEDVGALVAAGYGALSALTTGIGLYHIQPAPKDYLDGILIKRHYDWLRLPYKVAPIDTTALAGVSNNQFIAELWFPEPLVLNGKYGQQSLNVRLPAEDFSGLAAHYFKVRGYVGGVV